MYSGQATPCPLCGKHIAVCPDKGEDADAKMDAHIRSGCTLHVQRIEKLRCARKGCKAKNLRLVCVWLAG